MPTHDSTMQLAPETFTEVERRPRRQHHTSVDGVAVRCDITDDDDAYIMYAQVTGTDNKECLIGRMAYGWMVSAGDGWLATELPPTVTFDQAVALLAKPAQRKRLVERDRLHGQISAHRTALAKVERQLGL